MARMHAHTPALAQKAANRDHRKTHENPMHIGSTIGKRTFLCNVRKHQQSSSRTCVQTCYGGPPVNKTPSPTELPRIWDRSVLTPGPPDTRLHPDFEAPTQETSDILWETLCINSDRKKCTRSAPTISTLPAPSGPLGCPREEFFSPTPWATT
jgi:hypothetical protein